MHNQLNGAGRTCKLDPVAGDEEIRGVLSKVLSRRTKNNPVLLVTGVGKTKL
jgi:ATP-dependent Clp protease ATP-binding subunit ClpA